MLSKLISRRSFLAVSALTAASFALDRKRIAAYAAKMGPKSNYPTVIVGAGLGGLSCGAYLAKEGIPVTVVEQRDIPGVMHAHLIGPMGNLPLMSPSTA